MASAWLPVIDNLELALAHAGTGSDAIVEGVRAIRDQAIEILARLGYPRHDEAGVPSTRSCTRSWVWSKPRAPSRARSSKWCVRDTATDENQLRPAAVIVSRARE